MWKFHAFSVTQILREINFEESRSFKSAVFAILGSIKIVNLLNFNLLKVQKFIQKNQNSESLNVLKWQILNIENPKN